VVRYPAEIEKRKSKNAGCVAVLRESFPEDH